MRAFRLGIKAVPGPPRFFNRRHRHVGPSASPVRTHRQRTTPTVREPITVHLERRVEAPEQCAVISGMGISNSSNEDHARGLVGGQRAPLVYHCDRRRGSANYLKDGPKRRARFSRPGPSGGLLSRALDPSTSTSRLPKRNLRNAVFRTPQRAWSQTYPDVIRYFPRRFALPGPSCALRGLRSRSVVLGAHWRAVGPERALRAHSGLGGRPGEQQTRAERGLQSAAGGDERTHRLTYGHCNFFSEKVWSPHVSQWESSAKVSNRGDVRAARPPGTDPIVATRPAR